MVIQMANRISKKVIKIPAGVEVAVNGDLFTAKLKNNELTQKIPSGVKVQQEDGGLRILADANVENSVALSGTIKALISNMMIGLTTGFEKRLSLVGVGYKAQMQGSKLVLSLGFSHPVEFSVPNGVKVELPAPTEIVIKGSDKEIIGELAAKIRGVRPPEPYKGKGAKYADEQIIRKEGKKK